MSSSLINLKKRKSSELTNSLPEANGEIASQVEELQGLQAAVVQQKRSTKSTKSEPFEIELGHSHLALLRVPNAEEQQALPDPFAGIEPQVEAVVTTDEENNQEPVTDLQARPYKFLRPDPSTIPTETDIRVINRLQQAANSRSRLIHTGPSVQRLDSILEAQAELQELTRRSFVLCDRINYLVRAQVNEQLGLYAARYALESTYENLGYTFEEELCLDRDGTEIKRHASVRTQSDSNPDLYCFGRVVQVTGNVAIIKLYNQDRHIARLGRDIWLNPEVDYEES